MEDKQILVFESYFFELEKIVNHLNPIYGTSNNLFEKKIGVFHVFGSLYKNLKFLNSTRDDCPFASFATLVRMIIDHYSVFFLISSYSSQEVQKLRYYLLMMASLEGRSKTMSDFEKSLSNLPIEISIANQEAIKHDEDSVQAFIQKIERENLKGLTLESHINKRNWKFPSEREAGNKNFYNWQELYQIAKIPDNFSKSIQQHFSEFTHGLGLTVLYTEEKSDSKLSIIAILSMIQSLIGKIMIDEFSNELQNLQLDSQFVYNCNYNWENWK